MSAVEWTSGQGPAGPVPGAGGRLVRRLLSRGAAPPRTLAAVLWDMDGLLIDSEPLWTIAEADLAGSLGRTWTEEIKAACIGKRLDAAVPLMLGGLHVAVNEESVRSAGEFLLGRMAELFTLRLPVLPGALELLAECHDAGVPCALVSSSYRILVDACMAGFTKDTFAVSVAGDEVEAAKPSPKPYLLAAAALGVDPAHCLVLEDSVAGATAGVAAGCSTVLIPGATVPPPAVDLGWSRARSLADLSLAMLHERLRLR